MLKRNITIAFLSTIAFVVMLFEIPVFASFPWLKYDASDVVNAFVAFKYGPLAGLYSIIIRNILFYLYKGDGWGVLGFIPNTLASFSYIGIASYLYSKKKTLKTAVIALILGTIVMTIVMIVTNYIIVKYFFKFENILKYIIIGVVPFNLLKGMVNFILLIIIYKKMGKVLEYINEKF